jgi:TP901 family phage tail tape measure protein
MFEELQSSIELNAGDYIRSADRAERASDDLADSTEKLDDSAQSAGEGMSSFRESIGKAGAVAAAGGAAGFAAAAKASADFESQMASVQKVTSEETAAKLESEFKSLATEIPTSQKNLATLGEMAGKFGVEGSANISTFVESVGKISSATSLAAEEAGTRFAKIAGAVGLPMSEIDKLGNATNKLADTMKTDAGEITSTATRASNTLSQQLGLGKDAVLSLSASLNEVSPSARRAAGSLRRAAEALMDPGKAEDIASAIGLSTEEFRSMREESPEKLLNKVAATMNKGGEGATKLRGDLGKAATAFSKIGKQQDATAQAQEAVNKQFKNATSLTKEMKIRTETAAGQWQLFKNQLRNVAITTGDQVLPVIKDILKPLTGLLEKFGKFNEQLNGIPAIAGLVATTVGGLTAAFAAFWPVIQPVATTIGGSLIPALSGLLAPLLAVGAAVGALAAAFATNFGNIRGATSEVVSAIRNQLLTTARTINATFGPILTELANAWATMGGRVGSVAADLSDTIAYRLVGAIERAGSRFRGQLAKIATWWQQHGAAVTSTINQFSTHIQEAFIQLMAGVSTAIAGDGEGEGSFAYFFKEALGEMLAAARSLGITLPASIRSALSKVSTTVSTKLDQILAWWDAHKRQIQTKARTAYGKAESAVSSSIGKVRETVSSALSRAEAAWNTHAPRVRQQASAAYQRARTKISSALSTLNSAVVQPALSRARRLWTQHGGQVKRTVQNAYQRARTLATGAVRDLQNRGQQLLNSLSVAWTSLKTAILGAIRPIVPKIKRLGQQFGFLDQQGNLTKQGLVALGSTIASLTGPIGMVIGSAAKLATAWSQDLLGMQTKTRQAWAKIQSEFRAAIPSLSQITNALGSAVDRYMQMSGNKWISTISNTVSVLTSTFRAIPRGLGQVYDELLKPMMAKMQAFWRSHKDEIVLIVGALVVGVSEALRGLVDFLTRTLEMLGAAWKKWGDEILAVARFTFDAVLKTIGNVLDLIAGTIKVAMAAISGDWNKAWSLIVGGTEDKLTELFNFYKKWGSGFLKYTGKFINDVIQWWVDLAQKLIGGSIVPEMIADITSAFTSWSIVETVTGILSSVFDEFASLVTDVIGDAGEIPTLISGITTAFTDWTIVETVTGILSSVFNEFSSLVTDVVGEGGEIPTLISDITSAFENWDIVETVSGILESVLGEFSSLVTDVVGENGEIPSLLSKTTKKVEGWVSDFTQPFKNATDTVKGKFSDLKETVVGNSTVPDMLDDLVSHAEGSWSSKFTEPFKQAASSIENHLGNLKSQLAGALNGGGGGKPDWAKGLGKKQRRLINTAFDKTRITNNAGKVLGLGDLSTKARAAKALRDDVEGLQEAVYQDSPHVDAPGGITSRSGPLAVHELASGGQLLSDGLFYGHAGELVTPAAEVDRSPTTSAPATATGGSADIDEEALGEAIAENMDIDQEIILDAVFDRGATTDSILDEIDDRRTRQTGSST